MRSKTPAGVLILLITMLITLFNIIIIFINLKFTTPSLFSSSPFSSWMTNLAIVLAGIGTGEVAVHWPCVSDDILKALQN